MKNLSFAPDPPKSTHDNIQHVPRVLGYKVFPRGDGTIDLLIILDVMPTEEEERKRVKKFIKLWLVRNLDILLFKDIIVISTQDQRTGIYDRI